MYLKRLEIHGFKSFARKTTLEFGQGVVAVVGPNGSGKSNVADAVRWVLGEQSAKLIRGKKSDDVIFAGSDKKVRLGFAEVVATFDNRDHRIPFDASEVSIGRRVNRNGQSEYLLNGQQVRLLDIVDIVLKGGINTSRYTVIGQGTIDQMILSGPAEVKSLVDEASGVKTYYIRRSKTLRRLEQTANNLMRAGDLIKEIEPRLKSLRRQAKKMEARGEIETELKVLQRDFFAKTYWALHPSIVKLEGEVQSLKAKERNKEEEIKRKLTEVESQEQGSHKENENYRKLRADLNDLQKQKNKLLEDLSLVRGKMGSHKTFVKGDAQTISIELHEKTRSAGELRETIKSAKSGKVEYTSKITVLSQQINKINDSLENLYQTFQNPAQFNREIFSKYLEELEKEFEDFLNKLGAVENIENIKVLALALKRNLVKFSQYAKTEVINPQAEVSSVQEELQGLLKQKEELQKQLKELELNLSKTDISLEFSERELKELEQNVLRLDLELRKAKSSNEDDFLKELVIQEKQFEEEVRAIAEKIILVESEVKSFYEAEERKRKGLHELESSLRLEQDELSKIKDQEALKNIEKAKFDTQMEVLEEEIRRILGEEILKIIAERQIEVKFTSEELESKILKYKSQLDMIGGIDELTLKEYKETEERYNRLTAQVADLKQAMADLRQIMDELDEHIKRRFNQSFYKINEKFENYFRLLFNGGRAYLSLVKQQDQEKESSLAEAIEDEESANNQAEDISEELRPEEKVVKKYEKGASNIIGIDIKATPPGKKLSNIQALSGGERSLTSIALLCSLLTCFPSPFVVLDEVDAALDDANTIRFGQILEQLSHQTQFITVTHNRETMALADMLYGVTMGDDGVSKLLSVKLDQAKAYAK